MANDILKKVIRKFAISVFAVIYTFLALTQATFAWIVLNNEMQLENAELSVITGSSFYVSVDGKNFTTTLTNEMLNKVMKTHVLNDITSSDGIHFYEKDGGKELEAKWNYMSFPLYFKTKDKFINDLFLVDNVSENISYEVAQTETVDGTFVVSKGVNWTSNFDFNYGDRTIKAGVSEFYEASDAIRIAILEEDLDKDFDASPKEELLTMIYDPSENPKLGYGVKTGAFDYYEKLKGEKLVLPNKTPNTKYSLSKITNPYETNDDASHIARFQVKKSEDGTPWKYTKIRVNIWLEGWDADCMDPILTDSILIQLKFMGSNLTSK